MSDTWEHRMLGAQSVAVCPLCAALVMSGWSSANGMRYQDIHAAIHEPTTTTTAGAKP